MEVYRGIGVMSGTSHDGLDLGSCTFSFDREWTYSIEKAYTVTYSDKWKNRLMELISAGRDEIALADHEFGQFTGEAVKEFIQKHDLTPDFISSHGHTIFHQPMQGMTLQIGNGQTIADICKVKTINDFRSPDVKMGGQGAPLVPAGDRLLFGDYDYCLNIGGIANISYEMDGRRIAYDICPANMVMNMLAERLGKPHDDKGSMARQGDPIPSLVQKLESLPYYQQHPPKSLGREWVVSNVFPLLDGENTQDILASFVEHIVLRISAEIKGRKKRVLISGGGAYNTYLIDRLSGRLETEIIIPPEEIIDYKEALVFAFLGLLRIKGINNVLASVTGAPRDHCSGKIHHPRS